METPSALAPAARLALGAALGALIGGAPALAAPVPAPQEADEAALIAAEREEADLVRRRGDYSEALSITDDLLDDDEEDALTLAVRAHVRLDQGDLKRAERTANEALELARDDAERAAAARVLGVVLVRAGRADEVLSRLEEVQAGAAFLAPGDDPRDAWLLTVTRDALGDRAGAERFARMGAATDPPEDDWRSLLAKGRCQRRAGMLRAASRSIVAADDAAKAGFGVEPDVLVALADLYFESEREIAKAGMRSAGNLYDEALEIHRTHEDGLLGLFELHRFNRRRTSRAPEDIVADLLSATPNSVRGLVARASADLDDGKLVAVREGLTRLDELAPKRRDVRTLHATLAWIEHDRERTAEILEELLENAPLDGVPEREIGAHLTELYRFAEAIDFLQAAVQRDPMDHEAWTVLGECLANTGDEEAAREALEKADEAAADRQNAFRSNLSLVLDRIDRDHVTESYGSLSFSWRPDAAEVLRTYLVPYYEQAREELAKRYGFTPGPTTIAVFREHRDFSVRSVGFEGFPALGVCFGPVVTAVSPLSALRGSFSWARTGFHEFSHVVHLGLSNNRCPRWVTEGLATWEEIQRNPTWTRNMRRDLLDAYANGDLIPLRELNRAFRGPRILFGYYQGGLLCEMLIDEHGFAPMVALLRAFDLGADLDQAFGAVFDVTPEEVDADFRAFVEAKISGLNVEPRWSRRTVRRLQLRLTPEPPAGAEERAAWADQWCTIAWGSWQEGRNVDAERALQVLQEAGAEPMRATFLRGNMAAAGGQMTSARRIWQGAVEAGGREYRSIVALAQLQLGGVGGDRDVDGALAHLQLAVEAFPGYGDGAASAERMLSGLHGMEGRDDEAMRWLEEWTRWNAGEYDARLTVAAWHVENGRDEDAARLYAEANEVDMFRRDLHIAWSEALQRLERYEEALREIRVALAVPPELDPDHIVFTGPPETLPPGIDPSAIPPALLGQIPEEMLRPTPLTDNERADLYDAAATCADAIGDAEAAAEARALAEELRSRR
ncbi:MAG: tetratricopeptide repeat protein [Planctomycetota bacterium]